MFLKANLIIFYLTITAVLIFVLLLHFYMTAPFILMLYIFYNISGIAFSLKISDTIFSAIALKTVINLSFLPFLLFLLRQNRDVLSLILFFCFFYIIFFDSITFTLFQKYKIKPCLYVTKTMLYFIPNFIIVIYLFFLSCDNAAYKPIFLIVAQSLYCLIILHYTLINKDQFIKLYFLNKETKNAEKNN